MLVCFVLFVCLCLSCLVLSLSCLCLVSCLSRSTAPAQIHPLIGDRDPRQSWLISPSIPHQPIHGLFCRVSPLAVCWLAPVLGEVIEVTPYAVRVQRLRSYTSIRIRVFAVQHGVLRIAQYCMEQQNLGPCGGADSEATTSTEYSVRVVTREGGALTEARRRYGAFHRRAQTDLPCSIKRLANRLADNRILVGQDTAGGLSREDGEVCPAVRQRSARDSPEIRSALARRAGKRPASCVLRPGQAGPGWLVHHCPLPMILRLTCSPPCSLLQAIYLCSYGCSTKPTCHPPWFRPEKA